MIIDDLLLIINNSGKLCAAMDNSLVVDYLIVCFENLRLIRLTFVTIYVLWYPFRIPWESNTHETTPSMQYILCMHLIVYRPQHHYYP